MPSKSFSQARMMAASAHDPVFAKRAGVPTKVAKEFNMADKRSGFLKSAMRAKGPAYEAGGPVDPDERASALIRTMEEKASDYNKKQAEESRRREAVKPVRPKNPRKDPYGGDTTKGISGMKTGGAVKGAGVTKRGMRPAKYY